MKTWEEEELAIQQESIKKWARKKFNQVLRSWLFKRKLKKLSKLASIFYEEPLTAQINLYKKDGKIWNEKD